jgi:hypothetical protein
MAEAADVDVLSRIAGYAGHVESASGGSRLGLLYSGFGPIFSYVSGSIRALESDAAASFARWERTADRPQRWQGAGGVCVSITAASDDAEGEVKLGAFFDESVDRVHHEVGGRRRWIMIEARDEGRGLLLLAEVPASREISVRPNPYPLRCQRNAIFTLQNHPHPSRSMLTRLVMPPVERDWAPVAPADVVDWTFLTEPARPGTDEQRRFVQVALGTPDFALLEGPPGSGKTTAICELIDQLTRRGQRVLMCGSTHAAVDNVLERVGEADTRSSHVMAVRIGRSGSISERSQQYVLARRAEYERRRIVERLRSTETRTAAQDILLDAVDRRDGFVERMVLDAANLVCGTTIGILQHPDIKNGLGRTEPLYDVVILDEASKTTVQEFLVPGVLGRRWVIVGDHRQLSPTTDQAELAANLVQALGELPASVPENALARLAGTGSEVDRTPGDDPYDVWSNELSWRLSTAHALRLSERPPAGLRAQIEALLPPEGFRLYAEARERIQSVTDIALPSITESLQEGIGGGGTRRRATVLSEGIPPQALRARHVTLTYQHRMHPVLSALPRSRVYDDEALRDPLDMEDRRAWDCDIFPDRVAWIDVPGRGAGAQRAEADTVADGLRRFSDWVRRSPHGGRRTWSAAVITFYRDQERLLRQSLRDASMDGEGWSSFTFGDERRHVDVTLGTVDSFQGREADVVFLSIGRPRLTYFTRSVNRANVALTRARYQLVVVGDHSGIARAGRGALLAEVARSTESRVVGWGGSG